MAEREAKDRAWSWYLSHHGETILRLSNMGKIISCKPAQNVITVPKTIPDNLSMVVVEGHKDPIPALLEVEAFPYREHIQQVGNDITAVLQYLGKMPEVITLVLQPKGDFRLTGEGELISKLGTAKLQWGWKVVEAWTLLAEELLKAKDPALIPLVPLSRHTQPPEVILQVCKDRIVQLAPPAEHEPLLVTTYLMAGMVYNDRRLLNILLENRNVVVHSPVLQEILDERTCETRQADILTFLRARFGSVPELLDSHLRSIRDPQLIENLVVRAATCTDLDGFRSALPGSTN